MTGGYSGVGGAVNAYTTSNQPMWDFADSLTVVRGNHTLGMGVEYRQWSLNRDLADNFLGNFSFNGFATGNPVADMLLGYYNDAAVFQPGGFGVGDQAGNPRQFKLKYLAPYFQDDWKVTPSLTLNLGFDGIGAVCLMRPTTGWAGWMRPILRAVCAWRTSRW